MGTSKSSVPSPVPHLAWEQRDSTGDSPVSTQASDEAFCSAEVWRLTQAPQKLRVQAQDPAAQEQPPRPRWPWHGAGGSWAHQATHVPCWGSPAQTPCTSFPTRCCCQNRGSATPKRWEENLAGSRGWGGRGAGVLLLPPSPWGRKGGTWSSPTQGARYIQMVMNITRLTATMDQE